METTVIKVILVNFLFKTNSLWNIEACKIFVIIVLFKEH